MTMQPHLFGSVTIKALLEDPVLKNPPIIGQSNGELKVKKEDASDLSHISYGSAFLGPNLWDRSTDKSDFNLEYMDLDEFLSENGIPISTDDTLKEMPIGGPREPADSSCGPSVTDPLPASPCQFLNSPCQHLRSNTSSPPADYHTSVTNFKIQNSPPSLKPFTLDFQVNTQDLALASIPGEQDFDPRMRNFTEDELKPQPVIKKSKKIFVPEELKDEKYWARRHKNNFAARRSRDARRVKENQIAMRAAFLEKENMYLRDEMAKLQKENAQLKAKVAKYEVTLPANISPEVPQ